MPKSTPQLPGWSSAVLGRVMGGNQRENEPFRSLFFLSSKFIFRAFGGFNEEGEGSPGGKCGGAEEKASRG